MPYLTANLFHRRDAENAYETADKFFTVAIAPGENLRDLLCVLCAFTQSS